MAKQPKLNLDDDVKLASDAVQMEPDHSANTAKMDGNFISKSNTVKESDQNPKPDIVKSNTRNLKVLVVNKSHMILPRYETVNSAGLDLRANLESATVLPAHGRMLVMTGLFIAIPEGFEAQVRPRSGLALKHGITVLNTPGTIDADYRGEIGVILMNHTNENYVINPGDKIAQLVFHKYERIKWQEVDELPTTERGKGGFGHTGK